MSSSHELPDVDRFTTGTVGPPGQRTFYLQASAGDRTVTIQLEKAQVAALAEYLAELLSDLPTPEPAELPDDLELREPVVAEWVVGQIGVVFDDDRDRMLIRFEELQADDDPADPGTLRITLTRGQVAGFVVHAAAVVASGRPPCTLCGRPAGPEGHVCIKTNGHSPR